MSKFVVLVNNDGYRKFTVASAVAGGALVPRFQNKVLKKVFEIHNAWKLNQWCELPFKEKWYKFCFDESQVLPQTKIYFIFYESFHMSYSKKYLQYLKEKYKNSKFVFYFSNPVNEYNLKRLLSVKKYYDKIITFNKKDAIVNDFLYCNYDAFLFPNFLSKGIKSDVFFVGANKGRIDFIHSIYKRLTQAGLVCDFVVVDVPKEKQKYKSKIKYNKRITYEEVLQRVSNSRCVLEILQNGYCYSSIRTIEAFQYYKKILTTNIEVDKQWFYKPEIIQAFKKPEDIDIDFIRSAVAQSIFEDVKLGRFKDFADFIVQNLN